MPAVYRGPSPHYRPGEASRALDARLHNNMKGWSVEAGLKKVNFYDDLQDAVGRVPTGDMLIVAGDWNARPGPVDTACPGQVCSWHEVR